MATRAQQAKARLNEAGINSADDIDEVFLGSDVGRNRSIVQAVIFDGIPASVVANAYCLSEAHVWQLPLVTTRKVARGLPKLCNTERQLEERLKGEKLAEQHNGLPQHFAASARMALKLYPPEGRETMMQWIARLEKMP